MKSGFAVCVCVCVYIHLHSVHIHSRYMCMQLCMGLKYTEYGAMRENHPVSAVPRRTEAAHQGQEVRWAIYFGRDHSL